MFLIVIEVVGFSVGRSGCNWAGTGSKGPYGSNSCSNMGCHFILGILNFLRWWFFMELARGICHGSSTRGRKDESSTELKEKVSCLHVSENPLQLWHLFFDLCSRHWRLCLELSANNSSRRWKTSLLRFVVQFDLLCDFLSLATNLIWIRDQVFKLSSADLSAVLPQVIS